MVRSSNSRIENRFQSCQRHAREEIDFGFINPLDGFTQRHLVEGAIVVVGTF